MRRVSCSSRAVVGVTVTFFAIAMAVVPSAAAPGRKQPASAGSNAAHRIERATATATSRRTPLSDLTSAQRAAISGQALVGDPTAYARAKAHAERVQAARHAAAAPSAPAAGPKAPSTLRSWHGLLDPNSSPSDSTGAVGTTRYVELVNSQVGIYSRTSSTALATATLNTFVGAGAGPQVFDPQVMWDPSTNRFYYATDAVVSAVENRLAFGFSKTDSPSNATTDWCQYSIDYGAEFPDYPKLGDLSGLLMIGANVFGPVAFTRSDVLGITKPPSGTTCPAASSFRVSVKEDLRNADASQSTTPLPANQVDGNATGHVLAGKGFAGGNFVSVFNVTKNGSNDIVVGAARTLSLAAFSVPPAAPQPATARKLDTLDTRFTNAVSAIDPFRSNQVGIWTQHTVAGGGGSQVRWLEINPAPATPVPFQSGTQTNASFFIYNAAISPDRRRNGAAGQFGNGMLLHYSKSSTSQRISIAAVSKVDNGAVTGETELQASPSVVDDFACQSNVCRWGDYAGASPDPASDTGVSNGVVWGTNAWAQASTGNSADWRTQNFALHVAPK